MNTEIRAGIHNRFNVEVIDARTGKIRQRAKACNVICKGMYELLFTHHGVWALGINFGDGTGTPSENDTALFHSLGYKELPSRFLSENESEGVYSWTSSIVLAETEYVGKTLTEVGLMSYSILSTHAMLQDMNGNPISIEKTDTDIINIYATVFLHYDIGGYQNGEIGVCANMPRNRIIRTLMGADYYLIAEWLPVGLGGLSYGTAVGGVWSSDVSQHTITLQMNRIPVENWNNIGGIFGLKVGDCIYYRPNSYSQLVGESVGTGDGSKTDFETKFTVDPDKPLVVKVNGTAVSNYNYVNSPITDNAYSVMIPLDPASTDGNLIYKRWGFVSDSYAGPYFNPYHSTYPVTVFWQNLASTYASNDLVSWIYTGTGSIPEAYQHYKYYRFQNPAYWRQASGVHVPNIVFDEPPEVGAVITVDYYPLCVPKDSDHVYDCSVTITVGEYVPE